MSRAQDTRAARRPVVARCYAASPEACASALALLLRTQTTKERTAERLPSPDGRNDGPKSKEDSADEPKYSR